MLRKLGFLSTLDQKVNSQNYLPEKTSLVFPVWIQEAANYLILQNEKLPYEVLGLLWNRRPLDIPERAAQYMYGFLQGCSSHKPQPH